MWEFSITWESGVRANLKYDSDFSEISTGFCPKPEPAVTGCLLSRKPHQICLRDMGQVNMEKMAWSNLPHKSFLFNKWCFTTYHQNLWDYWELMPLIDNFTKIGSKSILTFNALGLMWDWSYISGIIRTLDVVVGIWLLMRYRAFWRRMVMN